MLRTIVFLAFVANLCHADIILSSDSISFNVGTFRRTGGSSITISATGILVANSSYRLSATVCFAPFCSEPSTGAPHPVSDPLTMRLKDFAFTCTEVGLRCGPAFFDVGYSFTFFDPLDPLIGTTVPVFLDLNGTAPPGFDFELFAGVNQANASLTQMISADANGLFAGRFFIADFTYVPAFDEAGFAFFIPAGSLSDSDPPVVIRNISLTFANTSDVPEPGTSFLLAMALGALAVLRRRYRRGPHDSEL